MRIHCAYLSITLHLAQCSRMVEHMLSTVWGDRPSPPLAQMDTLETAKRGTCLSGQCPSPLQPFLNADIVSCIRILTSVVSIASSANGLVVFVRLLLACMYTEHVENPLSEYSRGAFLDA